MGRNAVSRALASVLAVALALVPLVAVPALAASGPLTTIELLPGVPDGHSGWWLTPPEAFATADASSTVYYDWGETTSSVAAQAGLPVSLGTAPEGESTITAVAVADDGTTGTVAATTVHLDYTAPEQPLGLGAAVLPDGRVSLAWDASTDTPSGVDGYSVYRNLTGPPFSAGDVIGFTRETTFTCTPGSDAAWFYAVVAVDVAGNTSLMSSAVRASVDITPPSAPGDLQAWLNARGFARVSWRASIDTQSGVSRYIVERAFPGQPMSVVATLPSSALYWDDEDLDAAANEEITYQVTAYDRAGNASAVSGPVTRGTDLVAPDAPALTVIPDADWSETHMSPHFMLWWDEVQEGAGGSGTSRYFIDYGLGKGAPDREAITTEGLLRIAVDTESADWWFSGRAEDRAGNVSEAGASVEQRAITVDRVAGEDRVATALALSRASFPAATSIVVASARSFPDGLCAASLAGALDAPVLLVGPGPLRSDVASEVVRLGATDAYVVGGPPSVSQATYDSLDALLSGETTRLAGGDRFRTAAAVAAKVTALAGVPPRVFVVSGLSFADALSAGPVAFVSKSPILFATPSAVPTATLDALRSSGATHTVILGKTSSVYGGAEGVLPAATRIGGVDRYDTSALFAAWAVETGLLDASRPAVTTGLNFPDGLSAAPFAGLRHSPLLLTRTAEFPEPVDVFLTANASDLRRITVLGSVNAVSPNAMFDAVYAAGVQQ